MSWKKKTPEGYVKAAVMEYLAARRIYALRLNSGTQVITPESGPRRIIQMAPKGTADILALPNGVISCVGREYSTTVPLWIETKAKGGKLSKWQEQFKAEREEDGHLYLVAFSIDDVEECLKLNGF